jgi:hypothetical protein
MHAQPLQRSCSSQAIGGNHYGPVIIYMAKVSDAKTATSASWFKVAEDGYSGTTASWGTEILNANCGKRAFTVPKSLASGNYLVRSEVIALHAGAGNPQPYVSCFQVNVKNGGSANPAGVSFPGAYSLRYVDRQYSRLNFVDRLVATPSSPSPSMTPASSTSALDLLSSLVKSTRNVWGRAFIPRYTACLLAYSHCIYIEPVESGTQDYILDCMDYLSNHSVLCLVSAPFTSISCLCNISLSLQIAAPTCSTLSRVQPCLAHHHQLPPMQQCRMSSGL